MPQTTIILGAGSSSDFGMPLGAALYQQAEGLLQRFQLEWKQRSDKDPFFARHGGGVQWLRSDPTYKALGAACERDGSYDLKRIFDLRAMMKIAPVTSIDTLALENPEYLPICQALVSRVLTDAIKSKIKTDSYGKEDWEFCNRDIRAHPAHDSRLNWLHLFVSSMRSGLRSNRDRRFRFINFNYDRLAEHAMRRIWNLPSVRLGEFDDVIEFTYPHGRIAWSVHENSESSFDVERCEFVFAHNKDSEESFSDAVTWLEEADSVVSLGFNFAPENVRCLRLKDSINTEDFLYQNFDSNPGLDRRIGALSLKSSRSFSGPIGNAIMRGELGELPS